MTLNRTEIIRQGVFVVLLLGMLVGAWYFVFLPRDRADREMRSQIQAKQLQLQKLNRATATIGNLREEIADLEEAIEFFQSKLPNEKEIDRVLEEVWRLAESSSLTTKGIYTTRRGSQSAFLEPDATQAEQPIRMEFEGKFEGFYQFLLALESQPRIMRVRNISLKQDDRKEGVIKAEVEMSVFFERKG